MTTQLQKQKVMLFFKSSQDIYKEWPLIDELRVIKFLIDLTNWLSFITVNSKYVIWLNLWKIA